MSAVYVYAFTDRWIAPLRLGTTRLRAVPLDGLFAIASRRAASPALSEDALRRQHEAVERIAEVADAVLPARFGSLLDLEDLQRIAARRGDALRAGLARVRGRRQMTVRVLGAERATVHEPPASGTDYLRARLRLDPAAAGAIDAIRRAVRPFVLEERVERGTGATLATAYHLVAVDDLDAYRAAAAAAARPIAGLAVRVSGPWPPFAFTPELLA
jgi:hypothetical protein